MKPSLLLRKVRPLGGEVVDMLLEDGRIACVAPHISADRADVVEEGNENLVCPGFVDAHTHPGHTFVGEDWVDYEYPDTVPERVLAEKAYFSTHGRMNTKKCCYTQFRTAIARGTTHLRGHIDVCNFGLEDMEEAVQARRDFQGCLDVEYIAMPCNGILNMKNNPRDILSGACALGADGIGGADPSERDRDPVKSLDLTLGLAAEHGVSVDIHIHEFAPLGLFTLELLADRVRRLGLQDRVWVSHAWCLGNLPMERLKRMAEPLAELGIGIITHVPGHVPFPPQRALLELGVKYGVGTDNMRNLWSPFGMNNMLERVMLLAYLSDYRRREDLDMAFNAGTFGNAAALNLSDYGLTEGCKADLVVFPRKNMACTLLEGPYPDLVIKGGEVMARCGVVTDRVPTV